MLNDAVKTFFPALSPYRQGNCLVWGRWFGNSGEGLEIPVGNPPRVPAGGFGRWRRGSRVFHPADPHLAYLVASFSMLWTMQ